MERRLRPYTIGLVSLALLIFLPSFGFPQISSVAKYEAGSGPIRIRAERMSYDRDANLYEAEGQVEIWQGGQKLTADRVQFQGKSYLAEATGNVILVQAGDVLRAERMLIDLDTSMGIVFEGTLFLKQQNFYIQGKEIERVGENIYRVKGGSFTTCDGSWPAWRFTGEEALVTIEEYASVYGATFQVKSVPLFYTPYLVFPVKTQRQSGFLIPQVTYSNTAGEVANVAYYWAIAKNMDATFYLDTATKKGIGEGVEYRLARKKESSTYAYAYHIRESDEYRAKYTEPLDRKPDRWFGEILHSENLDSGFSGKVRLWGFSDRQYFKDYGRSYEERAMEQAYSLVSLTKSWERYSLSGEARHTQDLRFEDKTTLQNYPTANFSGVRQKILGSPAYFDFTSAYGNFYREVGTRGQLLDLYPGFSLPLKWNPYIEFTPEVRLRETYYDYRNNQAGTFNREMWEFHATTATEFYRIFETGWEGVSKVKHWIRPEIAYDYIPDVDQRLVPDYSSAVSKLNSITYSLTQRLTGKITDSSGNNRYHEYAYLRLSQPVNLFEVNRPLAPNESRRPFGQITADLKVTATQYFSVENNTVYDPNRPRFLSTYTLGSLSDSRGDSLNLEHRWQYGNVQEQINGTLRVRILSSLDAFYGMRYARYEKKNLERTVGINYRQQCWGVDVTYSEIPAVSGAPAEKKIIFMVNLLGIGSFGQEFAPRSQQSAASNQQQPLR